MDRYLKAIVSIVLLQILEDGLNRSEVQNSFQTNVTTGVILSVPSLLFPSSNSPSPDSRLVKEVTIALASRLAQVPHQEAVLKSLMKIRDAIGVEEFESYLEDYDNKLKKNIEILSKIYNVKSNKKNLKKGTDGKKNVEKVEKNLEGKWENDSDTSGIAEEEDEITSMPAARVVLETEIKFNEETAITMTILEEKDDSENEQNEEEENETDIKNEIEGKEDLDKRKTPRRVHFGGEIVKLRTPDSDDTESGETTLKTKIPLPVSPVTKMPINRLRPSSQPCSPHRELSGKYRRTSRSVSNSPKREIYTHNAELSPKKSILTRTSSPFLFSNNTVDETRKKKSINRQEDKDNIFNIESSANDKNMKIEIGGKVEKIKKEEVQNSQNNNAINPNIKINHSENVSLIIETSKNDSKVESDNLGMQNKIIDIKDISKDSLENKISENIQKNNMEKTNESLEINQKVDSFFGSVVKNEIELKYVKINQDGVIPKDVKLKNDKMNSSRNDNSDYVLKSVCEQISEYDEESENIRKNKNTTFRSDKMEFVSEEPNWEELGLVDHEVLEDLHNKVSFIITYFIYAFITYFFQFLHFFQ